MDMPEKFLNETELENFLAVPAPGLIAMMKRLDGDIMILGVAGKMGVTMAFQAVEAAKAAGVTKTIYGVARFSNPDEQRKLEAHGVKTIKCDLLNEDEIAALPEVKNIVFMAGRKFGTGGSEAQTWEMNIMAPHYVMKRFRNSRVVVFSTGCVYPLVGPATGGCTEEVTPEPIGEYSQSCLGRERILEADAARYGTKLLLFRLNYAIDLRYGVLHDIASLVWQDKPVSRGVSHFNVVWQGDANAYALMALELADNPVAYLNVTGPETISLEYIAEAFGRAFGKKVVYEGEPSDHCYLNNAGKCFKLLGYPRVPLLWMIERQAEWFLSGGRSLNKPTHFEVNNGKF